VKAQQSKVRSLWFWLFWAAAAFTLVMAVVPQPPDLPGQPSDKVQHMIAFATLAALAGRAFAGASPAWILLGLSLFGAAIEAIQSIPALYRDSDPRDWIADTVAAAFVLLVAAALRMSRKR